MTAFQYDWNMLPIGQQLWLKHVVTMLSPKYEAMLGVKGGKDWASTKPA
jgi:hypothetical protein